MLCEKEHINLTEKIKYELKGIVENKTEIMLHVYKCSNFACSLYIQNKILVVFSYVQVNK